MQSKHAHCPEHITYPANKMLPKEALATETNNEGRILRSRSQASSKEIKRIHTRRSRRFLKDNLDY